MTVKDELGLAHSSVLKVIYKQMIWMTDNGEYIQWWMTDNGEYQIMDDRHW